MSGPEVLVACAAFAAGAVALGRLMQWFVVRVVLGQTWREWRAECRREREFRKRWGE